MKKLTALAAILAATASMAAEVTSENIVGYANYELAQGFVMTSPQFRSISSSGGYNVKDIVANGADLNSISIQTLDTAGRTDKSFVWNDWMYETACWVDDNLDVADYTLAEGASVWVQGASGYTIQTAGEVATSDVTVELADGFVAVGNPFPVSVNIQDLIATGADLNDISIQTLDVAGRTDKSFIWNDWMYDSPCWVDDDMNEANYQLAPGEGMWIQGKEGYTIRIPAPEIN